MRPLLVLKIDERNHSERYAWVNEKIEEHWSGLYGSRQRVLTLVTVTGQVIYWEPANSSSVMKVLGGLPDNWTTADLVEPAAS